MAETATSNLLVRRGIEMSIRDLAYLSVRIIAIYLFIQGLSQLVDLLNVTLPVYSQTFQLYNQSFQLEGMYADLILIGIVPMLIFFIGSIVAWFLAGRLSIRMIPAVHVEEGDNDSAVSPLREMEGFVLSVVGLILFIVSFANFVRLIVTYSYWEGGEFAFVWRSNMAVLVEMGIRCLIGVILLVKAEGFAKLLRKIRGLGMAK
jgi:hypothetical protein